MFLCWGHSSYILLVSELYSQTSMFRCISAICQRSGSGVELGAEVWMKVSYLPRKSRLFHHVNESNCQYQIAFPFIWLFFLNAYIKFDSSDHRMPMLGWVPDPPTIDTWSSRYILNGGSFKYSELVALLGFQHEDIRARNLTLVWSIRKEVQAAQEMPCSTVSAGPGGQPRPLACLGSASIFGAWRKWKPEKGKVVLNLPTPNTKHVLNLNIVFQSSYLNLSTIWRRISQRTWSYFLLDIEC